MERGLKHKNPTASFPFLFLTFFFFVPPQIFLLYINNVMAGPAAFWVVIGWKEVFICNVEGRARESCTY